MVSTVEDASAPLDATKREDGAAPRMGFALLFSVTYPGLGHIYAGHRMRGLLWFFLGYAPSLVVASAGTEPGPAPLAVALFAVPNAARLLSALDALWVCRRPALVATKGFYMALALVAAVAGSRVVAGTIEERYFQTHIVPDDAVRGSLERGDFVFIDRRAYASQAVQRGDLVLVSSGQDAPPRLRRVVAVAGDQLDFTAGAFRLNGVPLGDCELGEVVIDGVDRPLTAWRQRLEGRDSIVLRPAEGEPERPPWLGQEIATGEVAVIDDVRLAGAVVAERIPVARIRGRAWTIFYAAGGLKADRHGRPADATLVA
ncbi:MAG: S26 family signal peptidase, partial [Myxococcota bacterium]